ncbi:hypothetical protein [Hymenobacter jeollabukensis]|uniref:Uncharacterized protein n=1 Tax=Hymenobacter jeollabukensis TaxID=2025313 RepID=A0A5R8WXI2_9BACT|nr:hypothetical protein [Hymenobacter jeollabukensis]TLM97079.1 hypothetical protein FDY95_03550 [Hymenobacter jeollabukensis]
MLVPTAALLLAACARTAPQQLADTMAQAAAEEKAVAADPDGEFGATDSGLIYSRSTLRQLRRIVDSLNYRFTTCDLTRRYVAPAQARAHYVKLDTGNVRQAQQDLARGISFEDFVRKYPQAQIEKELLVTRYAGTDYDEKAQVVFRSIPLNYDDAPYISFHENLARFEQPLRGKWVTVHDEKTEYSAEAIRAFYVLDEFRQPALPEPYARLVQYTDCMVDTSALVFTEAARRTGRRYRSEQGRAVEKFVAYVGTETQKPELRGEEYEAHSKALDAWRLRRFLVIDQQLAATPKFQQLFAAALAEARAGQGSDDEFEEYVSRYASPRAALELKRSRIVVGGCSMDDGPRVHALNIAKLAAESVSWEVFLRAHLDIMNDRFERVSDGSYAQARRQTYIRELEVLDLNVLDLLLGSSLRVQNASANHYYGNIGRLGRALAETEHAAALETKLRGMVADAQLDDYNRLLMFYLYRNYVGSLADSTRQRRSRQQLQLAAQTLPPYLADRINLK